MSATTADIAPTLLDDLRAFRLSKGVSKTSALVVKVDKKSLVMDKEELLDPITPDELAEELPEHSPRWAPSSASIELATLYASALAQFSAAADVGRTIDVRDGELSAAALAARLGGR